MFLGDYIYEYADPQGRGPPLEGGEVVHARAVPRALRDPQERSAPAGGARRRAVAAGLGRPRGLERLRQPAGQDLAVDMRARRTAAYRAYWEHMPFPKSARPVGADMRIVGRLDWGRLARIHLLDDRQYRDVQACPKPGHGGSNTVALAKCPALADPARTLLGAEQERWLADGWDLDAALEPARAADPDGALDLARPGHRRRHLLDRRLGRLRAGAQSPARRPSRRRSVPGVVVLGGDVHSNYVADLKADFDDPASPVVASEFCGTSITSLSVRAGAHRRGAPVQPAHPLRPRRPARLHELRARREASCAPACRWSTGRPIRRAAASRRQRASSSMPRRARSAIAGVSAALRTGRPCRRRRAPSARARPSAC